LSDNRVFVSFALFLEDVHAVKSLYELLTNVVESKQPKVIIRGGSHKPDYYIKSKTYSYCLKEAVEEAGFTVEMNLEEGNADKDFFFLTRAQHIIVTLGGFSRYVGYMVQRRGGVVHGRIL